MNFFAELDVGDAWELDEEDDGELSCYGGDEFVLEDLPESDVVTVNVDKRKSSTGSQVSDLMTISRTNVETKILFF